MTLMKRIIIYCPEQGILDSIEHLFYKHSIFKLQCKKDERLIEDIIISITNEYEKITLPDLFVFIRYGIKNLIELNTLLNILKKRYEGKIPNLMFVGKNIFQGTPSNVEIFLFQNLFELNALSNAFDRLLGTYTLDYKNRTIIGNSFEKEGTAKLSNSIPSNTAIIIDRIRASHMFSSNDDFPNWHVPYSNRSIKDVEEKYDELVFDLEDRYIESIDLFHQTFVDNERRVTYLLIGHRGCGKSSFIRYYFQQYQEFKKLNQPYIIIDYLNFYGLVEDNEVISLEIITALYKYYSEHQIAHLLEQFATIESIYSPDSTKLVIDYFKNHKVPIKDIISDSLFLRIDRSFTTIQKIHVTKMLIGDNNISDKKAIEMFYSKQISWEWLSTIFYYLSLSSKEEPFRFFANWLINMAFSNGDSTYTNLYSFHNVLSEWYRKYFPDGFLGTSSYTLRQLEDIINAMLIRLANNSNQIFISIENVDQLSMHRAEYLVMKSIYGHLAYSYPRLKVILSIRPMTYFFHKKSIHNDILPEYIRPINLQSTDDTTAYRKVWLHKVSLHSVLEKRILSLKNEYIDKSRSDFLNQLLMFITLPLYCDKKNRLGPGWKICDLIEGVTGNNVRDGLELFADIITSWYPNLTQYKGLGLFRENIITKRKYIADYMAVRAMFLESSDIFQIRKGLVNLFHVNNLQFHESMLIQIRILEILNVRKIISKEEICFLLEGLGYCRKTIDIGLGNMELYRLVSILIDDYFFDKLGSTEIILARARGDFYYEKLLGKLSYIQIAYFLTPLPIDLSDRLSFPGLPRVKNGDLDKLVNIFLHSLWIDISNERDSASKDGYIEYTKKIKSPEKVHERISQIYKELDYIKLIN